MVIGGLLFSMFINSNSYWYILPGLFLFGAGVPFVIPNCINTAIDSVTDNRRGMAAGIINCTEQVGGALGLAALGSILTNLNTGGNGICPHGRSDW